MKHEGKGGLMDFSSATERSIAKRRKNQSGAKVGAYKSTSIVVGINYQWYVKNSP